MAKRQVAWARTARERLRLALGGLCVRCGSSLEIEFDCIQPCGHAHHMAGAVMRTSFYRKQARAGNLQLLCAACHRKKSALEPQDTPF